MTNEIYHRLREQLDQYSIGFPRTESGVEIRMLEKIFTPEQAEMALHLTMQLETPEAVATRTERDPEATSALLDQMAEKGLVFRWRREGTVRYAAVPFVLGIYEYQLKAMDRDFARMFEDYLQEAFGKNVVGLKPTLLRTIPIHQALDASHPVAIYEDSREIVRNQTLIAVANCICRVQQNLIERACDKPTEVCFLFGSAAQHYIDLEMARPITTREALEILDRCEEAGLVTQPANIKNPGGMCNCCGDCCPLLRTIRDYPRPAELVSSNYYAAVSADDCSACETCIERCQMAAITIGEEGAAEVDRDRCIGCGLCVTTCSTGAMHLELKPQEKRHIPSDKGQELLVEMAQKRGKSLVPLAMSG